MNVPEMDAVLAAADAWVEALEALMAVKQGLNETEAESEEFDIAGSQLVVAVTRWRSSQSAKRSGLIYNAATDATLQTV